MRPGRWLVLTVRAPSEELSSELAEGLVALGGGAVQEEGALLTTYLPEPEEPESFVAGAADRLAGIAGAAPEITWRWVADQDWGARWKEGLAPRRVGRRITVTQPWNVVAEEGDRIVVVIDPATAFGTGEHATTRGALRLLEAEIHGGERVLDVGTGTGILSIAAVRLGADRALAAELDEDALDTARENLERNGVAGAVELVHAQVDDDYVDRARGPGFDLILANVLSGVLVPLIPAFARALRPGGRVILGGILDTEAAGVVRAAAAAGFRPVRTDEEEEWWTVLLAPD
ncbi:MAG: 50S ribosomal protein L11 methyltransferase [Gemmatimonadota bacterium]